jgi:hypothetical protein
VMVTDESSHTATANLSITIVAAQKKMWGAR